MKIRSTSCPFFTAALISATVSQLCAETITVTTLDDENEGNLIGQVSLREAIAHAAPDDLIIFDSNLNGESIMLTYGEQLLIDKSLTIDASALPDGITIDANGIITNHRIFGIESGLIVVLNNLTLASGNTNGNTFPDSAGGAIYADGSSLTLNSCNVIENSSSFFGGAIYNDGSSTDNATLTLNFCTFSGNTSNFGGAIYNDGFAGGTATLDLNSSTLSGNIADSEGGAIYNDAFDEGTSIVTLTSCTATGNSAGLFGGAAFNDGSSNGSALLILNASTVSANTSTSEGGAIYNDGSGEGNSTLELRNSILANNSSPVGPDLLEFGESSDALTTALGNNLVSSLEGSNFMIAPPGITLINAADLQLAPLGDYGGSTLTMTPLAGSPAIDAAVDSTRTQDQRGFAIIDNAPDIGAVESRENDTLAILWNNDSDGDGIPFGVEFALGTDPSIADLSHPNNLTIDLNESGDLILTFGSNPEALNQAVWIIERSTDLQTWVTFYSSTNPTGFSSVIDDSGNSQRYYRFRANQR